MALTDDDKKEILELYCRSYSQRRIADITSHSETTINNVIKEISKKVIRLKDDGMQLDQIAAELDCPLALVNRILSKYEEKQRDNVETEVETEVEPIEEVIINEGTPKVDFRARWAEFQEMQILEYSKEQIRKKAKQLIEYLEDSEDYYKDAKVIDADYNTRQKLIREELEGFVIAHVDEVDGTEAITELENIYEQIEKKVEVLIDAYEPKARESIQAQKARDKVHSDSLLNSRIDIPLFPEFIKNEIKERFPVKDENQASIVFDALFQVALNLDLKQDVEMWHEAMSTIRDGGRKYLQEMATFYRTNTDNDLISIGRCPTCDSKLTFRNEESRTIARCDKCNTPWRITRSSTNKITAKRI